MKKKSKIQHFAVFDKIITDITNEKFSKFNLITKNFQTAYVIGRLKTSFFYSLKLLLTIAHKWQFQHAHIDFFAAHQHFGAVAFKCFRHAGDGDGLFQAG